MSDQILLLHHAKLSTAQHKILTALAKRADPNKSIWYSCSLYPVWGEIYVWECFICNEKHEKRLTEIDDHGFQHLKDSGLLALI